MLYEERRLLDSGIPSIKKATTFPLKDLYKEPYSVLRVENGKVYSYHTPETMCVYLVLKYGRLLIKWVFVEDECGLRLYEYNTPFEYTGTLGERKFVNGVLGTKVEHEEERVEIEKGISSIDEKTILEEYGESLESFAWRFCKDVQCNEKGVESYWAYLACLFEEQIPAKNNNYITDDVAAERLRQYIYNDHLAIMDERDAVYRVLIDLAYDRFFRMYTDRSPCEHERTFLKIEKKNFGYLLDCCFHNLALREILEICLKLDCTDASTMDIPADLRKHFILMMLISALTLKTIPPKKTSHHKSQSKRLKGYLE